MPLIDCHLHLQDDLLAPQLPSILQRAADSDVRYMLCNGTRPSDWPRVERLAKTHRSIVPCFGLHPWFVAERSTDWFDVLDGFLRRTPSAIGEVGLDRWIEPRDEADQEWVFREHLALARRHGRPVMIHCLRAWDWLMDVLGGESLPMAGMLIHAYSGPAKLVDQLTQWGAYFSFAGSVLEERRTRAREALQAVPLDRLLIETDAPDMLPPPEYRARVLRGADGNDLNEPANLPLILRGIAAVRGESEACLADAVWQNARRLLGDLMT